MVKLSEAMVKLMVALVKLPMHQGMIHMNKVIRLDVEVDYEACEQLLEDLVINKDNVLTYLNRVYIPTPVENGLIFKDQKCIQKAVIIDDKVVIHIDNSEVHKILTDTIHVLGLMKQHGFDVQEKQVRYRIDRLKVVIQDLPLYYEFLKERDIKVYALTKYYQEFKKERPDLESVAKIKKRSVKRKYLRWYCKKGYLEWKDLRAIINIDDYSEKNIKSVCNEIRERYKERGGTEVWK